ncbi:replication factor C subunit 1 [Selaginella moellendorffii]|uniref:replication factor C subunit 1 n=1 Tax=Selaginella moellendorffii TaxID=88036 RepID=UPI000D1C2FD9|nr:replication factor C subunit 1 [Selaginella moellendorffii]|eukprot:XP_002963662.2 replication factor C subunit 1 [Selaginella moellendorffii]
MSGDLRKWLLKPHQKKGEEQQQQSSDAKEPAKGRAAKSDKPAAAKEEISPKGKRGRGKAKEVVSEEPAQSTKDEKEAPPKGRGRGRPKSDSVSEKPAQADVSKDDSVAEVSPKGGRGRGRGRGAAGEKPAGGRGRGGGRGNFNFGAREAPPHKGEKEVPEGAENALAGLTFVISGTLDSLEREEAEDLIKRHGGRVTSAVSKKTSFLLADEDVGGQKSKKAHDLGTPFITEDGLFDKIRASKPKADSPSKVPAKRPAEGTSAQLHVDKKPKVEEKQPPPKISPSKGLASAPQSSRAGVTEEETWPFKHKPKTTADIIANQSIVKQLKDWLSDWEKNNNAVAASAKGKKAASSSASKKAVLLCGPPGIGKTTTARLLCEELGYEAVEVNASDSRGKADSKIVRGIGGSTSNAVKEMVSNASLGGWAGKQSVLIMDEVDGMSAGDRGGVADLIASIKISKVPIICICNDRYSQKLKSLVNYCLLLSYRKPTKQQMAKRLQDIARSEKLNIDTIALEELSERTHGDMRLALNQLQYMSLHTSVLKYDDIKQYAVASGKDEDISPFSAVDKLMGFEGGRLKMDDRIDLAMSDMDLVPLIIQENYLNFVPSGAGRDANGTARMDLLAQAATSIASADILNVQIRRFRQWQLSRSSAFMSSIIPASLMHGKREVLTQGERNFNRFGGWLGKNSTFGKKTRLLEDVHAHVLCSRIGEPTRRDLRLDYFPVLSTQLTQPLRIMDKSDAVRAVIDVMEEYSLTQGDMDTILDITKFEGRPDPLEGVLPAVKAALTRGFTQSLQSRRVKTADLLPSVFPGQKKVSKKKARLVTPEDDAEGDEVLKQEEDEDEADEEVDEVENKESGLDALKMAKAGYEVNVVGENFSGAKRNGSASKTKQTRGKATTPSASASKGKGSGTKRKR